MFHTTFTFQILTHNGLQNF